MGLQENEMRKYVHSALGFREPCFSSGYNPRVPQRTLLQGPAPECPTFPPSPSWFHPQGARPCDLSTAWPPVPAGYQRAAACPRETSTPHLLPTAPPSVPKTLSVLSPFYVHCECSQLPDSGTRKGWGRTSAFSQAAWVILRTTDLKKHSSRRPD